MSIPSGYHRYIRLLLMYKVTKVSKRANLKIVTGHEDNFAALTLLTFYLLRDRNCEYFADFLSHLNNSISTLSIKFF